MMTHQYYSTRQLLQLYFDTLRHARARQLLHRLLRIVARQWPWPRVWVDLNGQGLEVEPRSDADFTTALRYSLSLEKCLARAEAVVEGCFTFLNQTVVYPDGVRWHDLDQSHLWRFHLHYFDYALDLGQAFQTTGNAQYWERFMALVDDWIVANQPVRGDGWHPFTISLRIVNWIRAYHLLAEPIIAEGSFRSRFLTSLYVQVRYMARNLEYDITGNHLIKNGKALVFAGTFFRGTESARWFERGLRILTLEAREQILDDGGHYERSPLYHTQVLADYLDVLPLIPRERPEYARLMVSVRRMLDFLSAILHPDGTLPLFNDGVLLFEPPPATLFQWPMDLIGDQLAAQGVQPHERPLGLPEAVPGQHPSRPMFNIQRATCNVQPFPASGYYIFRAADHFLILDCGPVCPNHLPSHAHCDLLSFELSVGGQRIITNSGTYQYGAGPWRDAFRGTAAHNTVQVNDEEQSAIWSSFRVGRRARVLEATTHHLDAGLYFRGRYVGFNGNRIEHTRELFLLSGPCWIFVDSIYHHKRPKPMTVTSRLHFHPRVHVAVEQGSARLCRDDVHLRVLPFGGEGFHPGQGWFSPDFGIKEPCPVLSLQARGEPPLRLGFVVAPEEVSIKVLGFDASQDVWSLELRCEDQVYDLSSPSPLSSSPQIGRGNARSGAEIRMKVRTSFNAYKNPW